jgi:GNAT superfamily N-acetyltransferase
MIRIAQKTDAPLLWQLVHELAEYEHLTHEIESCSEDFVRDFFPQNSSPCVFALLAFADTTPAGFAVWYRTYSTFAGRHGAFLEDLYVRPTFRGRGFGRGLFEATANAALQSGCSRLEWRALAWNSLALEFYRSLGASVLSDWLVLRKELRPSAENQ